MTSHIAMHSAPKSERAVLTLVLLDNAAIDEVLDVLEPADFTLQPASTTWAAMLRLHGRQSRIDEVTLIAELTAAGEMERVGEAFVLGLMDSIPSSDGIEHYARQVRELALIRNVIEAARRIVLKGSHPIALGDGPRFAAEAETAIIEAARSRAETRGPVPIREVVIETHETLVRVAKEIQETGTASDRIGTRFPKLDRMLGGGFRAGELHIVAGRPGMGKTAIALDFALSLKRGPGIVFSLEMANDELGRRAISSEARVDGSRIRLAQLSSSDWTRIANASGALVNMDILIDDTPGVSLAHVRAAARRQKARAGLAWILIDYLQLMESDERGVPREQAVGGISRGLKALAKELQVPVLALAQLNRKIEDRPAAQRQPQLADLRDSGSIEQDADTVLFIHREEVYQRDNPELRGLGDLIIGKQRAGPVGKVSLRYFHEYTRFEGFAEDDTSPRHVVASPSATPSPEESFDPEDFSDEGWR